ncbi:MAG: NYN domain-containing protein [Anaerolineales bacterium]
MISCSSSSKIGVYVDTANIYRSGGSRMQYDVLREFACRDGAELVRLNAYVSYDADRAGNDQGYREGVNRFYAVLRDLGYKVIIKEVKWYEDESGKRYGKANADLDMAVDLMLQTQNLDRVLLVSGDGDFSRVVTAAQNRGCRVEVVALDNVSPELRYASDMFISGYLIPNLVPTNGEGGELPWGEAGSRVRGVCYYHNGEHDYGFMRFMGALGPDLWLTDTKRPDSPYTAAYFRDAWLPSNVNRGLLPSYNYIFEFELAESNHPNGKFEAREIKLVSRLPG